MPQTPWNFSVVITLSLIIILFATAHPALAVPMSKDPKGFDGILWGSPLKDRDEFTLVDPGERIKGYEPTKEVPAFRDLNVDSIQFITIEGKFARVTVRYHGKSVHDQVLSYLESEYGRLDRTPGQMARGLNQQYTWRGTDTEINLTYQAQGDRGFVFFESRTLAPLFNDTIPER